MPSVALILLLKFYAWFMIIGSAMLWIVFGKTILKDNGSSGVKLWTPIVLIIAGLLLGMYFIDGWRP